MGEMKLEKNLVISWVGGQPRITAWLDQLHEPEKLLCIVTWSETVKAWQVAVQETLAAQSKWLKEWAEQIQVTSGSPTTLRKNVQQALVLVLEWTEAQQQLWQLWFKLVQQAEQIFETGTHLDDQMLASLQESGQTILKEQEKWVQRWTTWG